MGILVSRFVVFSKQGLIEVLKKRGGRIRHRLLQVLIPVSDLIYMLHLSREKLDIAVLTMDGYSSKIRLLNCGALRKKLERLETEEQVYNYFDGSKY